MSKPNVVITKSISYSGVTWFNLVLGSSTRGLTIGPPKRLFSLIDNGFKGASLVFGENDKFWPGFYDFWNSKKVNFFYALKDYSGADYFFMDNPDQNFIVIMVSTLLRKIS